MLFDVNEKSGAGLDFWSMSVK